MNVDLLREAAASARRPPRSVEVRDAAALAAELGRPLPATLTDLWGIYGEGYLGKAHVSGPREISAGLAMADRFLDEALLPFGFSPQGCQVLLHLDDGDDPGVVEVDGSRRTELGALGQVVEIWAKLS